MKGLHINQNIFYDFRTYILLFLLFWSLLDQGPVQPWIMFVYSSLITVLFLLYFFDITIRKKSVILKDFGFNWKFFRSYGLYFDLFLVHPLLYGVQDYSNILYWLVLVAIAIDSVVTLFKRESALELSGS